MLDSYRELIDELLGSPRVLRDAVAGRNDEDLPAAASNLLAELRDRDAAVLERVQRMTREPNPHLRALRPAPAASSEPWPVLLERFESARGDLVSLLMNLTLKDWERTATHEVEGEVTVADEIEQHVEFDEQHLEQILDAIGSAR